MNAVNIICLVVSTHRKAGIIKIVRDGIDIMHYPHRRMIK
jgi:hypothetical protein